jgi:hypothetical protein
MALLRTAEKFNPEDDLGFGSQPVMKSQPLLNRDGSVNVRRKGQWLFLIRPITTITLLA